MDLSWGRDEAAKERCIKVYKEEKRMVKRCMQQIKKEVNEQFGKKMEGYWRNEIEVELVIDWTWKLCNMAFEKKLLL